MELFNTFTYILSNAGIVIPNFQTKELRLQSIYKLPPVLKLPQGGPKSYGLSFKPKLQTNPLKVVLTEGINNTAGS